MCYLERFRPASVGIFALATPIIQVLFERGRFTANDVLMTATILQIYAFSILTYSGVRVIVSPYYAMKNMWFPATASGFALLVHYFLARELVFTHGVTGLAWSTVASSGLNFFLLFGFHFYFVGAFNIADFLLSFLKYCFASATMYLVLQIHPHLIEFGGNTLALALTIALGATTFVGVSLLIKTRETHDALAILKRKLNRKKAVSN